MGGEFWGAKLGGRTWVGDRRAGKSMSLLVYCAAQQTSPTQTTRTMTDTETG